MSKKYKWIDETNIVINKFRMGDELYGPRFVIVGHREKPKIASKPNLPKDRVLRHFLFFHSNLLP